MPGTVLDPVVGDPVAVASTARTMSSIADEVARQASRLRALATSASTWTGEAAVGARARSATLPPKLDKVTASYGAAAQALSAYASTLGNAQERSRTAISAAERAEADLQSATQAQATAGREDAAAAAAAAAVGTPAPSPTAPRYQDAIDDAAARVKQATTANEAAHEEQRGAATRAAAALMAASHQGILNRSWWSHVTHAVAHWAATQWRVALCQLAAVAGEISLLASIAGVVLAIGGLFFPPLEAAAALAETISMTTGLVASVSTTVVELSAKRTRQAGLFSVALLPVPGAAKKLTRFIPMRSTAGVVNVTSDAEEAATSVGRSIPLGFDDEGDFQRFAGEMKAGVAQAGYPESAIYVRGSSVTGVSHKYNVPFDGGPEPSDLDTAIAGPNVFAKAKELGLELRGGKSRTGPLTDAELDAFGLLGLQMRLSQTINRDVTVMIYADEDAILARGPAIRMAP